MKVTQVSYTRVLSDRCYGNHQATVQAAVEDGDSPEAALAEVRRLAIAAVEGALEGSRVPDVETASDDLEWYEDLDFVDEEEDEEATDYEDLDSQDDDEGADSDGGDS